VADGRFYLYSMEVVRDGEVSSLRTRANLTQPVPLGERTAYPFGWNGSPIGGYQVMLTTGGILGYALLLLIAVLAWPTARSRELAMRLLLAMPLLAVLLFLGGPLTILAELWNSVRQTANPESFSPLMAVSRFLMGGGGYALALLAAAVVVRQASCNLRPAIPPT
jgi:Na+/proline symporter